MTDIVVITIRHPDFENEAQAFGGDVAFIDVDYGRSNLANPEEYAVWAAGHQREANELRANGHTEAADYYDEAIRNGEGVKP